jgi:hypothetical protein
MARAKKRQAARRPKSEERELTIADALSEAYGEIATLGEEMRSWYEGMPEGPQGGEKGSAVNEAASALENIEEPDVPAEVGTHRFKFIAYRGRGNSRAKRRDDSVALMDAVIHELEKLEEEGSGQSANFREQAKALREEVDGHKDEADGVEFPGQFG